MRKVDFPHPECQLGLFEGLGRNNHHRPLSCDSDPSCAGNILPARHDVIFTAVNEGGFLLWIELLPLLQVGSDLFSKNDPRLFNRAI
jgi:hypothetical protein